MSREDFEIYKVNINGRMWYRFKVDYIGIYTAPTEKAIMELQKKIKQYVKEKLEWVEEENRKYYARLAAQERRRASLLKEAKRAEVKASKI